MAVTLAGLIGPYRDNPTSKRDFRAQLRGNKALWLWTVYLVLLLIFSMVAYDGITSNRGHSISAVQSSLRDYYQATMMMLAGAVCLITPSLTAGSIVVERQRKSLDLLFSAPVSLRGLLVGKVISSYRYTWMLLVLSIPLTSVAVVMGGATWADVLEAYLDLSFAGLVLTSIGLLISALCESVGAAVVWTYLASILYLYITAALGAVGLSGAYVFARSNEMTFLPSLNPFMVTMSAPTHTTLFGAQIPNFLLAGLAALLISRIFLLGAASTLSHFGSRETVSLRVHVFIYLFIVMLSMGFAFGRGLSGPMAAGIVAVCVCSVMFVFMPHLLCYVKDGGRKYGYDGPNRWSGVLSGARSGSLYYVLLLCLSMMMGLAGAIAIAGNQYTIVGISESQFHGLSDVLVCLMNIGAWSVGFFFMLWGLARGISSRARSLKMARAGLIGAIIVLFGLPIPVLSMFTLRNDYDNSGYSSNVWALHLMYPFSVDHLKYAPIYAVVMVGIGLAGLALEVARRPILDGAMEE